MSSFTERFSTTETNLRVIRGPAPSLAPKFEVINGIAKLDDRTSFQTQIKCQDSLIQEEAQNGMITHIRLRQLSNPPPTCNLGNYRSVTLLEISYPVDFKWVFRLVSSLPSIQMLRFGSSSFEKYVQLDESEIRYPIHDCRTMVELHIRTDVSKCYQTTLLNVNQILDYASKYFRNLVRAELFLPIDAKLDEFLSRMPRLKANGKEENRSFNVGSVYFTTTAKSQMSGKNVIPFPTPSPSPVSTLDGRFDYKSPPQSPALVNSSEARHGLKRRYTSDSSGSIDNYYDPSQPLPSPALSSPEPIIDVVDLDDCSDDGKLIISEDEPAAVPIPGLEPGPVPVPPGFNTSSFWNNISPNNIPNFDRVYGLAKNISDSLSRSRSHSISSSDSEHGSIRPLEIDTSTPPLDQIGRQRQQPCNDQPIVAPAPAPAAVRTNAAETEVDFQHQFTRPVRRNNFRGRF